ncbi:MAG: RagB/SusD family nutrient uptake outer membrane protein [Tannerellaceae bacterium]|jgi:hypothetical protein|nr:RagB/SusD family nutrient uptake outer membrane protein [Tannerellaceae bacterium]
MKKIYSVLFALITSIGFFSCEVTDISPKDSLTDESFWTKPEDLKLFANNFYSMLPVPDDLENQSDNFVTNGYNQHLFNESIVPFSTSETGWAWDRIRACNFFLTRYQKAEGSQEEINKYVAEVRFFKSLDYFAKIKRYGDVPYYEKDLQTDDIDLLYKARDPRDLVLDKIIEDLEFAAQWLPEPNDTETGRLHKYAALAQLARVCLHEGTWKKYHNASAGNISSEQLLSKAAQTAETIINSGLYDIVKGDNAGCGQVPFEGYPLYYSNQFVQESLLNNAECILPRIYEVDVVMHWYGRSQGESGRGFSKDFIESFLCKDGKPVGISNMYQGDETLEKEITNRDPRIYQVVGCLHKPYLVMNGEQIQYGMLNSIIPNRGVTGYAIVKFRSPLQSQQEPNQSTYDWFIYRYAEVLLIYAEAKAELGECTQDVLDKTINKLRDRVEMPHLTTSPEVDPLAVNYGYSISPLLYEIRRERRIELVAEGFRWDDIIRWKAGKLFENPKTFLGMRVTPEVVANFPEESFYGESGVQTVDYEGNEYINVYRTKSVDDAGRKWSDNDKRYLDPLPLEELTVNKNLTQNPGW